MESRDTHLRVFVVENSPILVKRIVEWLESDERVEVVGTTDTAHAAIAQIEDVEPDVVIIDIALGIRGNGFDVLSALEHRKSGDAPIAIVFSHHSSQPYRDTAMRLGAAYFFDKSNDFARMVKTVHQLAAEHAATMDGPAR